MYPTAGDDYSTRGAFHYNHTNAAYKLIRTMQVRNSITLIGNLGSAPTTSTLPSGRLVTEFSLATNDYFRDKNGDRQTRTDWHRIKAYGKLAEVFDRHLTKGSQVCIAGALRYNKWIDKHDQVRTTAEIVADSFTFLSASKQQETEAESDFAVGMVSEPALNTKATAKAKPAAKASRRKAAPTKAAKLDPAGVDLPF